MGYRIRNEDLLELLNSDSAATLASHTTRICHTLGFEHFVYGWQRSSGPFIVSAYPLGWQRYYAQNNLIAVDPTVAHSVQSCLPLIWSHDTFADRAAAEMYEEARVYGVKSGLSLPLHGGSDQPAMVSFASDIPISDERCAYAQSVLPEAMLVAAYMHDAARRLAEQAPPEMPAGMEPLTPRELECLRWSMAGKSSWETGQIIACSERTVNFHIGNAMRKLQVPNRRAAVVKALSLHLIGP